MVRRGAIDGGFIEVERRIKALVLQTAKQLAGKKDDEEDDVLKTADGGKVVPIKPKAPPDATGV